MGLARDTAVTGLIHDALTSNQAAGHAQVAGVRMERPRCALTRAACALPRAATRGNGMIQILLLNLIITVSNVDLIEHKLMTYWSVKAVEQIGSFLASRASGCLRVPS